MEKFDGLVEYKNSEVDVVSILNEMFPKLGTVSDVDKMIDKHLILDSINGDYKLVISTIESPSDEIYQPVFRVKFSKENAFSFNEIREYIDNRILWSLEFVMFSKKAIIDGVEVDFDTLNEDVEIKEYFALVIKIYLKDGD